MRLALRLHLVLLGRELNKWLQVFEFTEPDIGKIINRVDIYPKPHEIGLAALAVACKIENSDPEIKNLTREDFIRWLGYELDQAENVVSDNEFAVEWVIADKITAIKKRNITLREIAEQVLAARDANVEGSRNPTKERL